MYTIEITDTFAGEANYCWVRRSVTKATSRRGLIKAAKKAAGWQCRVQVTDFGDTLEVRPVPSAGIAEVAFVDWVD